MIAAPTKTTVELLRFSPQSIRTGVLFDSLTRAAGAAGVEITSTLRYRGTASWLMLWGPGAPDRFESMRRQLDAGGHVLCFDLAYWDRERKMRVSIDAAHPQAWVLRRDWNGDRLQRDGIVVREAWNPDGPIVIAGIGEKATVQYGAAVQAWEREMIAHARAAGKHVLYRPKRQGPVPEGVWRAAAGSIEAALAGASLVCTWHSNVAVDAIRLGIPVICRDGAAAAVCPAEWTAEPRPLAPEIRTRFLNNLAWFQWGTDPAEAAGCWAFLQALLA